MLVKRVDVGFTMDGKLVYLETIEILLRRWDGT
jgi:hypothetical protein